MGFLKNLWNGSTVGSFLNAYGAHQVLEQASNNKSNTEVKNYLSDSLKSILDGFSTSALKAEEDSTLDSRDWAEQQAAASYVRAQNLAKNQMDFQADQADLAWQRSLESVNSQMAFQERMQQQAMDFEERMSSTAYQRVVKDLKKAGLNPILAISQGSASTPNIGIPSGASASAQAMAGAGGNVNMATSGKADYSSAKEADLAVVSVVSNLLSSASKLVDAVIPH